MKRTVSAFLVIVLMLLTVAGCANREAPFLGKWSYEVNGESLGMYYIFEEKGVLKAQTLIGEQTGKPVLDYGSYKVIDDDTIVLTDTMGVKNEYTYLFEKDGTNLTMSDAEYIMSFTKVTEPEK